MATIQQGDLVFLHDGEVSFGTVQRQPPHDAKEIVIYIENAGEFLIPLSVVKAVHEGKVLLDKGKLHLELIEAIAHAHDREDASVSNQTLDWGKEEEEEGN